MDRNDLDVVAKLHQEMLSEEFIVRFGPRFLKRYYRAFADSKHAVALVAVDEDTDMILGALLGTLNPSLHYRYLTRRHGVYFAFLISIQALLHAKLAKELVRTRIRRYTQGVLRSIKRNAKTDAVITTSLVTKVSDITHLFVNSDVQSAGVGTSLILSYQSLAIERGVRYIDLVTAPAGMNGAGAFYEKFGWKLQRTHISHSGEEFLLYRLDLHDVAHGPARIEPRDVPHSSSHKISN
ncbi:GNAT family N-acetyltransferase [Alicyclobacillus sp. SO9]|nr:GNAT family N-acetyltransferase [Alicyclobacillus sp. SO9]